MTTKKTLQRDPAKGRIAGVCAGIAEYFCIEVWLVRILVVSAFFLLAGPFLFFLYVVAWLVLDKKVPEQQANAVFNHEVNATAHTHHRDAEKVVVKSAIWQAGESPKRAFSDISRRFDHNEAKLRKIERYVTSSEFQLNREFNNL